MTPMAGLNVNYCLKSINFGVLRNTASSFNSRWFCLGQSLGCSQNNFYLPYVPKSSEEVKDILNQEPISPPAAKVLKVALLGVPNSGKSTLINNLVNWKVCSVSKKVHTTVANARAVTNEGNVQLIFLDTPGIVSGEEIKKYKLKGSIVHDPETSLEQADFIAVLHDISSRFNRYILNKGILRLLALYPTIPSILILNKIDVMKSKEKLISIGSRLSCGEYHVPQTVSVHESSQEWKQRVATKYLTNEQLPRTKEVQIKSNFNVVPSSEETHTVLTPEEEPVTIPVDTNFTQEDVFSGRIKLTEGQVKHFLKTLKHVWPKFSTIFTVSALENRGVAELKDYLVEQAKPQSWIFNKNLLTDQSPQDLVLSVVRGKCLEHLKHNIPYEFNFEILYWDVSEADVLNLLVGIKSKKESLFKFLLGGNATKLRLIASEAEQDLRDIFRTEVRLRIHVDQTKPSKKNKTHGRNFRSNSTKMKPKL